MMVKSYRKPELSHDTCDNLDSISFENTRFTSANNIEMVPMNNGVYTISNNNDLTSVRPVVDELSACHSQQSTHEIVANVSHEDNSNLPCLTFRSVCLGLLFTCLLAFVHQFFRYRTSRVFLSVFTIQLVTYIMGKIMAKIIPCRQFRFWRWSILLNPESFTIKEHCIITVMATTAYTTGQSFDVISIQRLFLKRPSNDMINILFIITSQTLGYGMAGIMRKFLVRPATMVWPVDLVICAVFRALHEGNLEEEVDHRGENETKPRWTMSRFRFFFLIFVVQFVWHWFPGYIFPFLAFFSWICIIKPNNIVLSQLTGPNGLGMGSVQLDWNNWVAFLGSPIVVPFEIQMNILIGFVVFAWILTPVAYYTNLFGSHSLPIVSNRVFTIEGYYYNDTAALSSNHYLNETAYAKLGEMRITAVFAFAYGISFAAITAVIVHTILYEGRNILKQFRSSLRDHTEENHGEVISQYEEVPEWWYTILFVTASVTAALVCHFGNLMPWYFLFLDVAIVFIFILPTGIVKALTNQSIGLYIITQLIAGLVMPGDLLGNMIFKTYGYVAHIHALTFISYLKLGHYLEIPPRIMFVIQVVGTIISGVVHYFTANYLMSTIPNICTEQNPAWQCPGIRTFYSESIISGAIGPLKLFGKNSIYSFLPYGFLIGALLPIFPWLLFKRFPQMKWLAHVHLPIMFSSASLIASAPPGNYPAWLLVGFVFNFVIFHYAHAWWERYAYVFSAAMDCSTALSVMLIFFALQHNGIEFPAWWGTQSTTVDHCPLARANYSGIRPTYRN